MRKSKDNLDNYLLRNILLLKAAVQNTVRAAVYHMQQVK